LQVETKLVYCFINTSAALSEFSYLKHLVIFKGNDVKHVDNVIVTCNVHPLIKRLIVLLLALQ
jgi:hypothetical protein